MKKHRGEEEPGRKICVSFMSRFIVLLLFVLFVFCPARALNPEHYTNESVLATGRWVKISVTSTGIHEISFKLLKDWGFADPYKVRIYGYGGADLPESFSSDDIDDLPQIPFIYGDSKLLFYAQGTISWKYDSKEYVHSQNTYTNEGYYFLTDKDIPLVELKSKTSGNVTGKKEITEYPDYQLHEEELYSPGKTGRLFVGEDFRFSAVQNFPFSFPGIVDDSSLSMTVSFGARTTASSNIKLHQNEKLLSTNVIAATSPDNLAYNFITMVTVRHQFIVDSEQQNIKVNFIGGGTVYLARLDYIRFNYKRKLQLYGGSVGFRNSDGLQAGSVQFVVDGATESTNVWDVTTPCAPVSIKGTLSEGKMRFTPVESGLREYVAFNTSSSFPSPGYAGTVANQNLHGMDIPEMVIITPAEFQEQAERIAELHRTEDNMKVSVVEQGLIYNEFSSGAVNATAYRRFMKMFYDRAADESQQPKYLLLFGNGSYDNRKITETVKRNNYPALCTYQSVEGKYEEKSYVTDDYFGYLDDSSTNSQFDPVASPNYVRLGIGRFPVKTVEEAKNTVNKLYSYVKNKSYGAWKNQVCFVADDGNNSDHMSQSDIAIKQLLEEDDGYFANRIYIDAFEKKGSAYPEAKKKMMQLLNDGLLLYNYIGHGNTTGLTGEDMLNMSDIRQLYLKRLPFMITSTCDFSRFDSDDVTAGEELFLHPNGGAIALITSTRVVWISSNLAWNRVLIKYLFTRKEDGTHYRLGDVIRLAKNERKGNSFLLDTRNKLNYSLLGDPALKLAYPEYQVRLTEINGSSIENTEEILNARAQVTIKGEVLTPKKEKATDYTGVISTSLYDTERSVTTNGNADQGTPYTFNERDNRLYLGQDSVKNGEFTVTFRMPKDINFADAPGLFNLYTYDSRGNEGNGSEDRFIVGGMDDTAEDGEDGPSINYMYLNSESFQNGDKVNESPMLLAEVESPVGINLSSAAIGHNMTIKIDDSDVYSDVSSYFTPALGVYGKGTISYPLSGLSEGDHKLTFKVWDADNVSSEASIDFKVKKGLKPTIYDLYADCNPAQSSTNFYLRHNRPDALLYVKVSVYNMMGVEVWSKEEQNRADMFKSTPMTWDLNDKSGTRVPAGIYLYRASVSTDKEQETTKSKRLVVLKP